VRLWIISYPLKIQLGTRERWLTENVDEILSWALGLGLKRGLLLPQSHESMIEHLIRTPEAAAPDLL
jgi:hypothetical protein